MLTAKTFPERAARLAHRSTDPYLDHLKRRWSQGCHNARVLFAELVDRGFRGSYHSVRRTTAAWRAAVGATREAPALRIAPAASAPKRPSTRRVSWLLFVRTEDLDADELSLVDAIRRRCPPMAIAMDLAREFRELVKRQQPDQLADWIARACNASAPPDVRRFALGLLADQPLIEASLALPWSNGQIEGQINRLKLIKRETYGRAKLDLLQVRFLHAMR